jgi:hypothetical protein
MLVSVAFFVVFAMTLFRYAQTMLDRNSWTRELMSLFLIASSEYRVSRGPFGDLAYG